MDYRRSLRLAPARVPQNDSHVVSRVLGGVAGIVGCNHLPVGELGTTRIAAVALKVGHSHRLAPGLSFIAAEKKRSPFARTMVISIANGSYGYLPTPEQHKLGGYEAWLGTCRVQEDSSVVLTDQLLEMLAELDRNVKAGSRPAAAD